VDRVDFNPE
jgi:cullin 1